MTWVSQARAAEPEIRKPDKAEPDKVRRRDTVRKPDTTFEPDAVTKGDVEISPCKYAKPPPYCNGNK